MNTGEMLDHLSQYGKPRVGRLDGGWFAAIELPIPAEGAAQSVSSAFGHPTHESALTQLLARLDTIINSEQKALSAA